MKRKVNLVGTNTLTVSLPTKWCQENNVRKGTEIDSVENGPSITFSATETISTDKAITLDITKFSRFALSKSLQILYHAGYNRITLTYSTTEIKHHRDARQQPIKNLIKYYCDRFIGLDITSQTSTKTEISCFLTTREDSIDAIERRISYLLAETHEEFLSAMDGDFASWNKTLYDHHDNIVKYVNYVVRKLNEVSDDAFVKRQLTKAYTIVDMYIDCVRHTGDAIERHGSTPRLKKVIKSLFAVARQHVEAMIIGVANETLPDAQYATAKLLAEEKYTQKELEVVRHIQGALEGMQFLYEAAFARSLAKQKTER